MCDVAAVRVEPLMQLCQIVFAVELFHTTVECSQPNPIVFRYLQYALAAIDDNFIQVLQRQAQAGIFVQVFSSVVPWL